MGKKKWLGAVKRVFSPNSKSQKSHKLKEKLPDASQSESFENSTDHPLAIVPHQEDFVLVEAGHGKREESHPDPVIAATAAADQNAGKAEVSTGLLRVDDKSREEAAAIKIQTAFRGHLARRALRALRGLVRLKTLIHGNSVKRQATTTLRCMQTLARVQSQIRSRRIRMSEENQALQRQLLLKREKELENLKMGDEWDDSLQSKQQIEAGLLSKQEAATKRERALAYAFSHQWKNSSRSANPLFMDPNNPHWGWSWLERWMAARPWETKGTSDREPNGSDRSSVKAPTITDAYANRDKNPDKLSPSTLKPAPLPARQSPSTPTTKVSALTKKVVKSASPRSGWAPPADDTRSVLSVQSERPRRHSLAGSSVRDDESFTSSPAVPSYMVPTESARARSRFQSGVTDNMDTASEKGSVNSVKKRLSFPVGEKNLVASSSLVRRHSGPPKVDVTSAKDGLVTENGSSGGSK